MIVFSIQITVSQTIANDTILGKELLRKAESLSQVKNYKAANQTALEAASLFQKIQKWDAWYKAYYAILLNGFYAEDHETSIELIQKGLLQLPETEVLTQGKMFALLGYCYDAVGAIADALTYYEKSVACFKTTKNLELLDRILGNISLIYTQQGKYEKAQHYSKIAITYAKSAKNTLAIWKNTKALGDAYFYDGNYEKALQTFKKAQAIKDDKDGTFELIEANILYVSEQYNEALVVVKKAIRLTENCKNDASKNQYLCRRNFNEATISLGNIYIKLQQPEKALAEFLKSIPLVASLKNSRDIGQLYILIGDTYKITKQYDKALENYQKALQTFIQSFKEVDPSKNPPKDWWTLEIWLLDIFRNKGDCYIAKYETTNNRNWLTKAVENYEFAVDASETKRLNFTEAATKLNLGAYSNEFYEKLIKVNLALYAHTQETNYQQEAFKISQRANAFVLRELLNEQEALKVANIPKDTIALWQESLKNIAVLSRKIEDSIEIDSTRELWMKAKEDFEYLKAIISKNYPKFDKIRNDLEGVSVADIQHQIDANTICIKYFLGAETLYIFSISKQYFFVDEIQLPEQFQESIAQYREALSDISFIQSQYNVAEKQFLATAFDIYKTILEKPIQHHQNNTNIQQLIIIPDGILHAIPFQTLITQQTDSWTNIEHSILKKYAVSYHYFCKMLLQEPKTKIQTNNFTAFGLELDQETIQHLQTYLQDSLQNSTQTESLRNGIFSKLAFADEEATQLAALMQGTAWINTAATKKNFITHATNSKSIHLATHALLNTKNPNVSALIFTKTNNTNSHLLRLDEIYNHNFNADMITLSACNTGFGKYQKGEGLQSLARAFNFSNIPSVTATLWSIPDASSAHIMTLYYKNLQQGFSKSVALQQAQLEYLENDEISSPASRLPFYWAAWTHIGNNDSITFKSQNKYTIYYLIAFGCLLLFVGLLWFKKTRSS
ncbi:CHAT domain-containing protein [Kordia jejudonensis]|uniref:CHAT domain-containing protein n=1 Tax=Kordia jejudonensis TaxID=1348245 RepID=UPI0012E0BEC0|nr:CHAT domain-containing protein [Kordia jejudonensis]